jgi:hypothetical protein
MRVTVTNYIGLSYRRFGGVFGTVHVWTSERRPEHEILDDSPDQREPASLGRS